MTSRHELENQLVFVCSSIGIVRAKTPFSQYWLAGSCCCLFCGSLAEMVPSNRETSLAGFFTSKTVFTGRCPKPLKQTRPKMEVAWMQKPQNVHREQVLHVG